MNIHQCRAVLCLVQPSLATGGTAAGLGGWGAGLATLTDWVTDSGLQ